MGARSARNERGARRPHRNRAGVVASATRNLRGALGCRLTKMQVGSVSDPLAGFGGTPPSRGGQ